MTSLLSRTQEAFSYEENQRPLHSLLAQVLRAAGSDVNAITDMLSRQVLILSSFTVFIANLVEVGVT